MAAGDEAGDPTTSASALRYRPEIDGLRGLAIVAVMLFHAGVRPFGGGFVGVDVFFVISGYLITSILLHDFKEHKFSLADFYERRARRILPALFLVMAVSSVFACRWLLPYGLESFGKSVLSTSLSAHNILLTHQSGYWAPIAEYDPLLNTWSLGVEAQYYLVFPILFILAWRYTRPHAAILAAAVAIASIALAQSANADHPVAVFYLLPTRAWELMLGSLATCVVERRQGTRERRSLVQVSSGVGLLLVIYPVVFFDRGVSGPGFAMLVPTLGAALIIAFATRGTLVFGLLTSRVMVGLGLISYSLYLWHAPVIAFARIYCVEEPSAHLLGALALATIPVAYLSWRFVERPFRAGPSSSRAAFVTGTIVLTSAFSAFGSYLVWERGFPERFNLDPQAHAESHIAYNERAFRFRKSAFETGKPIRILVTGNSFARDFVNMMVESFDLDRVEIVYRDDLDDCVTNWSDQRASSLWAAADVIVRAGSYVELQCVPEDIALARRQQKALFYAGTKYFGRNLNWIARLNPEDRPNQWNRLPARIIAQDAASARAIPAGHYISLLAAIRRGDDVPVTDERGRLISLDRTHLTREGARYVGRKALLAGPYGALLRSSVDDPGAAAAE